MVNGLLWGVVGASVQGAQHKLLSTPNQDALGRYPAEGESGTLAVALADGHGYPKGVRAGIGATLAVQSALDISKEDMMYISNYHDAEVFLSKLAGELPALWKERVLSDLSSSPLEKQDLERLVGIYGHTVLNELNRRPEIIYGTTVMLALCTPDYVMLAQLGDGNILIVDAHGSISSPIQDDTGLVANQTWSLSSPDTSSHFRVALLPVTNNKSNANHHRTQLAPELIMMATDGYANSYVDYAGFELVGMDVLKLLRHYGIHAIQSQLPGWLESTSEYGSGDDITAAFIVQMSGIKTTKEHIFKDKPLDEVYSQMPGSILKKSQVGKPSRDTGRASQS